MRLHLLPFFGKRQLRAINVGTARKWQNELRARVGNDTVMGCGSLLYRILQAAEDDQRIEANPVRKVPAPERPVDAEARLGRAKRRAYTPRSSATSWPERRPSTGITSSRWLAPGSGPASWRRSQRHVTAQPAARLPPRPTSAR